MIYRITYAHIDAFELNKAMTAAGFERVSVKVQGNHKRSERWEGSGRLPNLRVWNPSVEKQLAPRQWERLFI